MNTLAIKGAFKQMGFQLKKHAPTILMGVGAVGTVASTVLACKATTKAQDVLIESKEQIEQIHVVAENGGGYKDGEFIEYTEEDHKKDLVVTYAQTGVKLAKLYAPAIGLGIVSLGCMFTSHGMMRKRNLSLVAAYAAVDKGFKEYRGRVIDRFGEAVDKELKYNIKADKVTEVVTDPETGKDKKVKKTIEYVDATLGYSPYARIFDECNSPTVWENDAKTNLTTLIMMQSVANQKLAADKYLFLNDVYKMLGMEGTVAGQSVGWIYDEERGDGYVDFGIAEIYRQAVQDFAFEYESSIILDFNVDGPILNHVPLAKI